MTMVQRQPKLDFCVDEERLVLDGAVLFTEASSIGLEPGRWPERIGVFLSGRMLTTVVYTRQERLGEDGGYVYRSSLGGPELHVIND